MVIEVDLTPEFKLRVFNSIKYQGVKRTETLLLAAGYHQTFVKVLIRAINRTMGW